MTRASGSVVDTRAWGRVLGAAVLRDRGDVGELGERVLEPREPILCENQAGLSMRARSRARSRGHSASKTTLSDPRHRRGVASREREVGRRAGDLDGVGAGVEREPLECLTAAKRRSAGGRAEAGAVLGDAMQIDEVVFCEPRQELVTSSLNTSPWSLRKVEAVIGDRDAAAQPAVGGWSSTSRAISCPEPTPSRVA